MREGMENFLKTGLYALTAEDLSRGRTNLAVVEALIQAGVRFLQYREKDKPARAMYEECREIRAMTRQAGVTFIVNDRVDLALAVAADGVHVGQGDLPPEAVRKLIGAERILGLSTHDPEQYRRAKASGVVDYVGVGPIFETLTKKDVGAAVGVDYVRFVAADGTLPFVAIGGIKPHNLAQVVRVGASTVAVVSAVVGAADIGAAVAEIRRILTEQSVKI